MSAYTYYGEWGGDMYVCTDKNLRIHMSYHSQRTKIDALLRDLKQLLVKDIHMFMSTHVYWTKLLFNDDDVSLQYYSGKGFHINNSCLLVLRKTHKQVQ
jgi:hypothetical protein